jgi:hypothetical protein
VTEELRAAVDEALAPTAGRLYAESLRLANDQTLAELNAKGLQVSRGDILHLHLSVLLDTLLGDMDDERRQAYEVAVHTKLAESLAEVSAQAEVAIAEQKSQAARAALLQGVQQRTVNPHPHGPTNGRRR